MNNAIQKSIEALEKAIDIVGSQAELARRLGTTHMVVWNWKLRGVPAKRCRDIEEVTAGAVTRYELREDFFGKAPEKSEAAA